MNEVPRGEQSVMARRLLPPDSIEMFPTPPFATRALFEHVLPHIGVDAKITLAWDPMCGQGHMTGPMAEYVTAASGSDIFDYGVGAEVGDFFDNRWEDCPPLTEWIITNPPFGPALEVVLRSMKLARYGVCVLLRTVWLEGGERYTRLFRDNPPTLFAPFVERVPMVEGRWDPDAASATSYAWFCFVKGRAPMAPFWIPPGRKAALTKPDDRKKYAPWSLLDDDPDEVKKIACELCAAEGIDPDGVNNFIERDVMTYRERKAVRASGMVFTKNWKGRRRRADDILAMRLMARAA